jgi:small subunit ribosomal protein S16
MSVTIRLSKIGKRNAPAYKIVVANTRDKRNGRYLDILGHYNPSENPVKFSIDKKKVGEWQKRGALITEAVEKLIAGTYEFKPYDPKGEAEKAADQPETAEAVVGEPEEKIAEKPTEVAEVEAVKAPVEQPVEKPAEEPKPEAPVEQPAESPAKPEQPAEQTEEK